MLAIAEVNQDKYTLDIINAVGDLFEYVSPKVSTFVGDLADLVEQGDYYLGLAITAVGYDIKTDLTATGTPAYITAAGEALEFGVS